MNVDNGAVFQRLRDGYRAGIPEHFGVPEITAIQRVFSLLAKKPNATLPGDMLSGSQRDKKYTGRAHAIHS